MASAPSLAPPTTNKPARPAVAPPRGPRLPMLLQSYLALQWLVPYQRWAQRRYGDVFTVKLIPVGRGVAIADPALIKEVLTGDPAIFHAGDSNRRFLKAGLGSRGLLVIDGDDHLATRKRMLPPFHGESIRRYEQVIREETEKRVARWRSAGRSAWTARPARSRSR